MRIDWPVVVFRAFVWIVLPLAMWAVAIGGFVAFFCSL
jgi:ABC-type spermidine/putrescine transport system permease subunit II